jgi:dolichol kinase
MHAFSSFINGTCLFPQFLMVVDIARFGEKVDLASSIAGKSVFLSLSSSLLFNACPRTGPISCLHQIGLVLTLFELGLLFSLSKGVGDLIFFSISIMFSLRLSCCQRYLQLSFFEYQVISFCVSTIYFSLLGSTSPSQSSLASKGALMGGIGIIMTYILGEISLSIFLFSRLRYQRNITKYIFFTFLVSSWVFYAMLPLMNVILGQNYVTLVFEILYGLDSVANSYPSSIEYTEFTTWISSLPIPLGLKIVAMWITLLCIFIPTITFISNVKAPYLEIVCKRKLFHILGTAMFAPVILLQRDLLILSFGVAGSLFIGLEFIRVSKIGNLSNTLSAYLSDFTDKRDEGRLIIWSHIHLLVGCAIPLICWVYICTSGFVDSARLRALLELLPHLGWLTVGVGDAFGAVFGKLYGSRKWPGTSRTYEGSLAAFTAMTFSLSVIVSFEKEKSFRAERLTLGALVVAGSTLVEAITNDFDNLLLPIFSSSMYVMVCLFYTKIYQLHTD